MQRILALLPRIGLIVLFVIMASLVLFMAYIFLAPDTWPKPVRVVTGEATPAPAGEQASAAGGEASVPSPAVETTAGEGGVATVEIRPGEGIMLDTGSKIVNLVDPTGRKYLRVSIVLEFAPTDLKYYTMAAEEKLAFKKTFEEELTVKMPIINDIIITMLSNQTFESVYTAQGKEELRRQLLEMVNKQLHEYRVIYVYFTEFVVQ